ncbi:MAG: hypothetical protein AAF629_28395 [Chloroflexota bacterium]
MKRYILIFSGVFVLGLAVTMAIRMTSDAMAVIVGIILGMLATVPTSLLLLYLLRQREQQQLDPRSAYQTGQYPPVVVVNSPPNSNFGGIGNANPQSFLPAAPAERSFTVVGQEASTPTSSGSSGGFNRIFDEIT